MFHCFQFQCRGERWNPHRFKSCKQWEGHCHGPKHPRRLSNANFLNSLNLLILLNFNVVEKNGTLIKSSLPFSPILTSIKYVCFFFNSRLIENEDWACIVFCKFGNCNHSKIGAHTLIWVIPATVVLKQAFWVSPSQLQSLKSWQLPTMTFWNT